MIQTPTQSDDPPSKARTLLIACIIVVATIPALVTLWWTHHANSVHATHTLSDTHPAPHMNPWAALWNRTIPTACTPTPTMVGWGNIVSAQADPYTTSLFPTIEAPPPLLLDPTPTPAFLPSPSPDLQIVGYNVHVVEPGEDIFTIAANGGSDAPLLGQYNKLTSPPQEGCPLIVPQIAGTWSMLCCPIDPTSFGMVAHKNHGLLLHLMIAQTHSGTLSAFLMLYANAMCILPSLS